MIKRQFSPAKHYNPNITLYLINHNTIFKIQLKKPVPNFAQAFSLYQKKSVVESYTGSIACMQQFMGFVRIRFTEVLFVQFNDLRIVVGLTYNLAFIF